jgi:uncharacterized protein (UPF0333 family)
VTLLFCFDKQAQALKACVGAFAASIIIIVIIIIITIMIVVICYPHARARAAAAAAAAAAAVAVVAAAAAPHDTNVRFFDGFVAVARLLRLLRLLLLLLWGAVSGYYKQQRSNSCSPASTQVFISVCRVEYK